MQIIVDGRPAVLKEGSSFDFIAENRLFSGSDSYTLTITFPLKDCPQNIEIFGHIYRSETVPQDITFDCEIRDRAFSRFGTLTITEISDFELKAQFLEGRAEQNFSKRFDETYINELDLSGLFSFGKSDISPEWAWDPSQTNYRAVALPWVSADSGISHNFADYNTETGKYSWKDPAAYLTWQPYLVNLTSAICSATGYSCNLTEWVSNYSLRRLIVCNVFPATWDITNYARCLPHWTVAEYLEKLEILLRGEFSVDHRTKKVSFRFSSSVLADIPPVRLDSVVDEYTSTLAADGASCDYLEAKPFAYKDADHQMWPYMSCPWILESVPATQIVDRPNVGNIVQDLTAYITGGIPDTSANLNDPCMSQIFHAVATDEYFMLRNAGREYSSAYSRYENIFVLQPLNEFGPSDPSSDANPEQVEFVPACIDFTEARYGMALFVDFGSYSEGEPEDDSKKSPMQLMIEAGKPSEAPEYFDTISVAYYSGSYDAGKLPLPMVSNIVFHPDRAASQMVERLDFDLRLHPAKNSRLQAVNRIDRTRKVTFKFLADDIPNPRALYYIHGRRYICEKITATFTEDGMSQLLKGDFWPLVDD